MNAHIDEHGRAEPPYAAGEAETLLGFLDFQRATLSWRTEGLDAVQLQRRLEGHPSKMTLGGWLKHLFYVEFFRFEETVLGQPTSEPRVSVDWSADQDWDWNSARQHTPAELIGLWSASVLRSNHIVRELLAAAGATALEKTFAAWGGREDVSLRWVLTHMIEEYARHNGHADLLREQVDGQTGE